MVDAAEAYSDCTLERVGQAQRMQVEPIFNGL